MRVLAFVALSVAAGSAAAQRTWVVDSQNRPGTDFLDIPPAITAAADGDTILVRSAGPAYSVPVLVTKAVTLLGERPGTPNASQTSFEVRGIPAGRTFVMKNFTLYIGAGAKVVSAIGGVHFEDVNHYSAPMQVLGSTQVTLNHVNFSGAPALRCALGSNVALTNSTLWGNTSHAAEVNSSRLTVAYGTLTGGTPSGSGSPYEALRLNSGSLVLVGDGSTTISAGLGSYPTSAPAILAAGGDIRVDPRVRLISSGGAARISGPATVQFQSLPALKSSGAWPGNYVDAEAVAAPGDLVVFVASASGTPLRIDPLGELWLDPLAAFYFALGQLQPGGRFTTTMPIDPGARLGAAVAWQVLAGQGSSFLLSNPVVVVLQ